MDYNYNENTLLHSVGMNLQRFVSSLENGILSLNKAKENDISYVKNYDITTLNDDYISCLKVFNINFDEDTSSYNIHTNKGINFIIEDVNYLEKSDEHFIHHFDEVLVKDKISNENIKGIAISKNIQNTLLNNIVVIPVDINNTEYIINIVLNYLLFLQKFGYKGNINKIEIYFTQLKQIENALKKANDIKKYELMNSFKEVLLYLNKYLATITAKTFENYGLYTLLDAVYFLSNTRYEVYDIPQKDSKNVR